MPYIDQKTAVSVSVLYDFSDSIRLKSLPFDKRTTATDNRHTIITLLKSTHVIYNKGELSKKKLEQIILNTNHFT